MSRKGKRGFLYLKKPKKRVYAPRRNIYCKHQASACPHLPHFGKSLCCVWCPDQVTCNYSCDFLEDSKWKTCGDRVSRREWVALVAYKKIFAPPRRKFSGAILSTPLSTGYIQIPKGTNKQKGNPKQKVYKSGKGKK